MGQLEVGHKVNIERSLKMGDEEAHLVSGHVYCMGSVESSQTSGESIDLKIGFPNHVEIHR